MGTASSPYQKNYPPSNLVRKDRDFVETVFLWWFGFPRNCAARDREGGRGVNERLCEALAGANL